MNGLNKQDVFKIIVSAFLSILTFLAYGIYQQQDEIEARLRTVENNQSAIMARLDIQRDH